MTRRGFLALAAAGCAAPPRPPLQGADQGLALLRAHGSRSAVRGTEDVDVLIVGAGVAGLTAAWRLRRAGYGGTVAVVELADQVGGTAASGRDAVTAYPWGAHYITLPERDCRYMHAILEDAGVLVGWEGDLPRYDPFALCFAPEERLFQQGRWEAGLWPRDATPRDREARDAFLEEVAAWRERRGGDGRFAFAIPVARSSVDPAIRALADVSFAAWLDARGYTGERFRWWAEYACRDDYGTTLEDTSAWAGLHYFASRRPAAADSRDRGTDVLTWASGNGVLVDALARHAPPVRLRAVARAVAGDGTVEVEVDGGGVALRGKRVILAVPSRMADRLTGAARAVSPDASPWRVAQVAVEALPAGSGVPTAWDSVIFGSSSLGYVTATHQAGQYRGPSVLSWYEPLTGDPVTERKRLLAEGWAETAERVLTDLEGPHAEIRSVVTRVDTWRWGHGTTRPGVGLHRTGVLDVLQAPWGAVHFAHTDQSGVSLFEEAAWQGIRAAEEVLVGLGHPLTERLA